MYATSSTNNSSLLAEAYFVAFFQNIPLLFATWAMLALENKKYKNSKKAN